MSDDQAASHMRLVTHALADLDYFFNLAPSQGGPVWTMPFGDAPRAPIDVVVGILGDVVYVAAFEGEPPADRLAALMRANNTLLHARLGLTADGILVAWTPVLVSDVTAATLRNAIGGVLNAVAAARKVLAPPTLGA